MRLSLRVLVPLLLGAAGCDGGAYGEPGGGGATARRDVTYLVFATGAPFRYRLVASGVYPHPVTRDTAGSVALTYSVPCGSRVALTTDALGAVPAGAALELLMAVHGQALASARGTSEVRASATLRCD